MRFSDGFEKIAIVGPIIDLGHLGIPSALGYALAKSETTKSGDTEELVPSSALSKGIKWAFIPGYTGYRLGLAHGMAENRRRKEVGKHRKDKDSDKDRD